MDDLQEGQGEATRGALPWGDRARLRAFLIDRALGEPGAGSWQATCLLSTLPHPDTRDALLTIGLSTEPYRARAAQGVLAELPELALPASVLADLLERAAAAAPPGPPYLTARLLRGARSPEALAVARRWLADQSDAHLDALVLDLDPLPEVVAAIGRERFDAGRLTALHAALRTWNHPGSRRLLRGRDDALTYAHRRRLLAHLARCPAEVAAATLRDWPATAALALSELLLPSGILAALFGEDVVLARCLEVIDDAEDALATLAARELDRRERFDRLAETAATAPLVSGTITEVVKGGWIVDIGMPAFLPGSQVVPRTAPDKAALVGRRQVFRILKLRHRHGSVIVSGRDRPEPLPPGPYPLDALLRDAPPPPVLLDGHRLDLPNARTQRAVTLLAGWPAAAETLSSLLSQVPPWSIARPLRAAWLGQDAARALAWSRSLEADELQQEAVTQHIRERARRPTAADAPLLRWAVEAPSPARRYAALHGLDALGEAPDRREDPHPLVAVRSLSALARRGDAGARAALLAHAASQGPGCVEALRWLPDAAPDEALPLLTEALEATLGRPDRLDRYGRGYAAAIALARLDTEAGWAALLAACLRDGDKASELLLSLLKLGLRGEQPAAPTVLTQRDPDRYFNRLAPPPR